MIVRDGSAWAEGGGEVKLRREENRFVVSKFALSVDVLQYTIGMDR